jgi:hypothetical protein
MENWKDIKGYEEYYEVSDLGNVRSKVSGDLLKPFSGSRKYLSVDLGYIGKPKRVKLHKLVMETFNPEGYFKGADIDHKDGNKQNNTFTNLEYVTHAENILRHYRGKAEPMIAVSPTGDKYEFLAISEFAREHGLEFRHVSACLKGKLAHHKQWVFYLKSEGKPKREKVEGVKSNKPRVFIATSPNGEAIEGLNQRTFAEEHDLSRRQINACLNGRMKTHKGWAFKFKEEE